MADELDPLPDDLRAAFDAERRRPDVDDAMRARLLGRVLGSVAVGAAIGAAAGTASAATSASAGAAATSGAAGGLAFTKMAPWLLGAFLLGGGVGAAVHAAATSREPQALTTSSAPSASPPVRAGDVPTASASAGVAEIAVSALPTVRVSAPAPGPSAPAPPTAPSPPNAQVSASGAPSAAHDADLAAERALVDRARTALTRGQATAALEALDAHAKSFPRGRLAEEREALAVDALVRAGRAAEAASRADRFRTAWPNSVFGGLVDTASPPKR